MKIRRRKSPAARELAACDVSTPEPNSSLLHAPQDAMLDEAVANFVDALVEMAVKQWLAR